MRLRFAALLALALTGCPDGGVLAVPLPVGFDPAALPDGAVGVPYDQDLTPSGGVSPYQWTLASGTLPPGLALDPIAARIAGTPTRGGVSETFTIRLSDSQPIPGTFDRTFTITVPSLTALDFTPTSLPDGVLNLAYSSAFTPSGGFPPYTWSVQSGSLPDGLSLTGGAITGTPTSAPATASFTIRLSDSQVPPDVLDRGYSIDVHEFPPPVILPPSSYAAVIGRPFTKALGAAAGVAPLTWSLAGGALPDGLSLSAAGVISGTPTMLGGPVNAQVRVADSQAPPADATRTISITVTAAVARFAYVLNQGSGAVSIYTVRPGSGILSHASTYFGPQCSDLISSPDEKYLYACTNDGNVRSYAVDPIDGRLTLVDAVAVGNGPLQIVTNPAGTFLFTPNYFAGTVASIPVDPATGELGTVVTSPLSDPRSILVSPSGTRLYVGRDTDEIYVYAIDPVTGALTQETVIPTVDNPLTMALSPGGAHLYVGNAFSGGLSTFAVTPVTEVPALISTVAASANPQDLLVHPSGLVVYLPDGAGSAVRVYARDPATGVLTFTTATPTGSIPMALALSPEAGFLWTANLGSDDVSAFSVSGAGALTAIPGSVRARIDPLAMVVLSGAPAAYSPRMAYVTDEGADRVRAYAVDDLTGRLVPTESRVTGANPRPPAVHPRGGFLYVPDFDATTISRFSVDPASGALTPQSSATSALGTRGLAIEPSAGFAYSAGGGDDQIRRYSVDPATGALVLLGTTTLGSDLHPPLVDPSGSFLYVPRFADSTLRGYASSFMDGSLFGPTSVAAGAGPVGLAAHPSGRFVYSSNQTAQTVTVHGVTAATGQLSAALQTTAAAPSPGPLAADPIGRFLYVSHESGDSVRGFTIAAATGLLTSIGSVPCGDGPAGLDVDPSGRWLYVACRNSATIEAFSIHPITGALTPAGSVPGGTAPAGIRILHRLD